MGSIPDLLKHLPEAAKSPLAFFAYCLVIAAWVLQRWLVTKPQRHAKAILTSFKDDRAKLAAVGEIFNEPPPHGLKGNQAILDWVKVRSAEKTKVLLTVAWLATLVAVFIFLLAMKTASTDARHVSIKFYRTAGTHSSCPLPPNARVRVLINAQPLDELDIVDCEAKLHLLHSKNARATLALVNAGPYKLFEPSHTYDLAQEDWYVTVQGPFQITLFNYSGQCPNLAQTFGTFETLVRSKANSLRGMFPPLERFEYLSTLSVVSTGEAFNLNNYDAHTFWQRTGSIQLLAGMCHLSKGREVMHSEIYFGDLKGKLPSESLEADLPVTPEEFSKTRDLHTASMLYSLAQEAQDRQRGRDLIIDYLSEARLVAKQIESGSGKQLKQAIDKSLNEINAPPPMELPK